MRLHHSITPSLNDSVRMSSCLFCRLIGGEIPSHQIYSDDRVVAFLDIHPHTPGHTLIVPRAHAADLRESNDEDLKYLFTVAKKIAPAVLATVGASAFQATFNTGADAGQVIFHTHLHLIPRTSKSSQVPSADLTELAASIRAKRS